MAGKYDMTNLEEFFEFVRLNRSPIGYALINQGVDTEDRAVRGFLSWLDFYSFGVEFFLGEGTPREIEKKGMSELCQLFGDVEYGIDLKKCLNWDGNYAWLFRELAQMTRKFLMSVRPLIIEFEWHHVPTGWRPDNWIFWEWRVEHSPEQNYATKMAKIFSKPA